MSFEKVKILLDEGKAKHYFERAILVVGNEKGVVYEHQIEADRQTLFDMASMTKVMATTMVALRFIEAGKLSLYDTLADYFDDVPDDKKEITIKHLMTHQSGIEPHFIIESEARTREEVIATILKRPLYCEVGQEVFYSCMGYILLGKILEKIGGAALDVLAKQYVFEPLGMCASTFKPPLDQDIVPTEYSAQYGEHLRGVVHDENARFIGVAGNAGLFSTMSDVMRFSEMLLHKGVIEGKSFLSPAIMNAMTYNYTPGKNEGRGLGVSVYQHNLYPAGELMQIGSYGHTGFTGTSLFVDPVTKVYVALLTNRVYHGREDIRFLRMRRVLHNVIMSDYTKGSY